MGWEGSAPGQSPEMGKIVAKKDSECPWNCQKISVFGKK